MWYTTRCVGGCFHTHTTLHTWGIHSNDQYAHHQTHYVHITQVLVGELTNATLQQLEMLARDVYLPLMGNPHNRMGWPDTVKRDVLDGVERLAAAGTWCVWWCFSGAGGVCGGGDVWYMLLSGGCV